MQGIPRIMTQGYLVAVSCIMAWIVVKLPEVRCHVVPWLTRALACAHALWRVRTTVDQLDAARRARTVRPLRCADSVWTAPRAGTSTRLSCWSMRVHGRGA